MVSLNVPLDMPGFGNEKHIILDSNLFIIKNLSRVEFFLLGYIRPHIHSSLIHKYDTANTPYLISECFNYVTTLCSQLVLTITFSFH